MVQITFNHDPEFDKAITWGMTTAEISRENLEVWDGSTYVPLEPKTL